MSPLTQITKPNLEEPKTVYKKRGRPKTTGTVKLPKSFSASKEEVEMLERLADYFATNEAPNNSATVCRCIVEMHGIIFGEVK